MGSEEYALAQVRLLETLTAIRDERKRQDLKWGEQNHPDGTTEDYRLAAESLKMYNDLAAKAGNITWRDILMEEVFEAFTETDPEKLAEELVQVAAVAVAWLEHIKRRQEAKDAGA